MSPDEMARELALLKARVQALEEQRPGRWFELEERGLTGKDDVAYL
jgi:hypothetical protein